MLGHLAQSVGKGHGGAGFDRSQLGAMVSVCVLAYFFTAAHFYVSSLCTSQGFPWRVEFTICDGKAEDGRRNGPCCTLNLLMFKDLLFCDCAFNIKYKRRRRGEDTRRSYTSMKEV